MEGMKQYLVSEAPSTVYYIPNFISPEEGDALWKKVYSVPGSKWTKLSQRRLQNWGGIPHPDGMFAEKLAPWLEEYCSKIQDLGVFGDRRPNHVLINEYIPGQGILPHEDGPLYAPTVSTISLGSHTLLDFYQPLTDNGQEDATLDSRYILSLLLEPNSLLVLQGDMYKKYLHGIATSREEDAVSSSIANLQHLAIQPSMGDMLRRSTRVSLTIRHVPKTIKLKLKFRK